MSSDYNQLHELLSKSEEFAKYEGKNKHTWCSGCGNYGIINALKRALVLENIQPKDAMLCYDVGCSGNESDKIGAYTIHGLHGRVLPLATGIALANPDLTTVAMAGDGATLSEGINHLIHTVRNNHNFTFILHNNSIYGLTIGQASSTTRQHQKAAGTSGETYLEPLNAVEMILSLKPSFVARSFSGDVEHATDMIRAGLQHDGFSFIEILQTCPTFNKATPQEWYWDKIVNIKNIPEYNNINLNQAREIAMDMDQKIAVGILYQNPKPSWESQQMSRMNKTTALVEEVQNYEISNLLSEFRL